VATDFADLNLYKITPEDIFMGFVVVQLP
jgi:hypothetical protein